MNEEEQRKRFAIMIADTIQQILRESDDLSGLLRQAHKEGYDVFLSIFSGVIVRRKHTDGDDDDDAEMASETASSLPEVFEFTEEDRAFLKSIGIQVTE